MAGIIQNLVDMVRFFGDAAVAFPTSILLLLMGFALITGSLLVGGYLAAGAAIDAIVPDSLGRPPQQRG